MQSDGFEPVIPEIRLIQTYTLDRTATGTGIERMGKPRILRRAYVS